MKKIIVLFAFLVGVSIGNFGIEKVRIGELYYNLDETNKTAEVTGEYREKYNYSWLKDVEIPASVTYNGSTYVVTAIGDETFFWCAHLTTISIPNTITTIGYKAFYVCDSLVSPIVIPESVTVIETSAFTGCKRIPSITIGQNVTRIGKYAFEGCRELESVIIPDKVISIGESAFSTATRIKSVQIGNNVKRLRAGTFKYCFELKSIVIGSSVNLIDEDVFYGCDKLSQITCLAPVPPVCTSDVFKSIDKSITVFVPAASVVSYTKAEGWKDFDIQPIAK